MDDRISRPARFPISKKLGSTPKLLGLLAGFIWDLSSTQAAFDMRVRNKGGSLDSIQILDRTTKTSYPAHAPRTSRISLCCNGPGPCWLTKLTDGDAEFQWSSGIIERNSEHIKGDVNFADITCRNITKSIICDQSISNNGIIFFPKLLVGRANA